MPDRVDFFVDSVRVKSMRDNVPNDAGRLFLNHWSNGSPGWSGGPPESEAVMTVLYAKAYFNSSDAARIAAAAGRCRSGGSVCRIPGESSDGAGAASGGSGTASGQSTIQAMSSVAVASSAPSSALPGPGRVPFLSVDPGNVVGQILYNATSCDGCNEANEDSTTTKKKKSSASRLGHGVAVNYSISYAWILLGIFVLVYL